MGSFFILQTHLVIIGLFLANNLVNYHVWLYKMESIFSIMALHHLLYATTFKNVVGSQTTPIMNSLNHMGIMVVIFD
jgi:hypothetical protein